MRRATQIAELHSRERTRTEEKHFPGAARYTVGHADLGCVVEELDREIFYLIELDSIPYICFESRDGRIRARVNWSEFKASLVRMEEEYVALQTEPAETIEPTEP